ncbi:MAG: thioredoxin family protein [Flavobacteriales bacterium]|nr:thioredoxin family protein [Flavobacteriales bacterium]
MVTKNDISRSISFEEFYKLIEKLAAEGGTTGDEQTQEKIDFTKLNYSRLKRILKTTTILEEVKKSASNLEKKMTWLVIAESWCGDAIQNVPVMYKMSETIPNLEVRIILRDENPDLMNQYLTNGGKSIPKLICLDENRNELGTWGPRPQFLQDWMKREKANPTMEMSELKEQFQIWYTKDKGETLQREMLQSLISWSKKECV